jgi:hypothetical protein
MVATLRGFSAAHSTVSGRDERGSAPAELLSKGAVKDEVAFGGGEANAMM